MSACCSLFLTPPRTSGGATGSETKTGGGGTDLDEYLGDGREREITYSRLQDALRRHIRRRELRNELRLQLLGTLATESPSLWKTFIPKEGAVAERLFQLLRKLHSADSDRWRALVVPLFQSVLLASENTSTPRSSGSSCAVALNIMADANMCGPLFRSLFGRRLSNFRSSSFTPAVSPSQELLIRAWFDHLSLDGRHSFGGRSLINYCLAERGRVWKLLRWKWSPVTPVVALAHPLKLLELDVVATVISLIDNDRDFLSSPHFLQGVLNSPSEFFRLDIRFFAEELSSQVERSQPTYSLEGGLQSDDNNSRWDSFWGVVRHYLDVCPLSEVWRVLMLGDVSDDEVIDFLYHLVAPPPLLSDAHGDQCAPAVTPVATSNAARPSTENVVMIYAVTQCRWASFEDLLLFFVLSRRHTCTQNMSSLCSDKKSGDEIVAILSRETNCDVDGGDAFTQHQRAHWAARQASVPHAMNGGGGGSGISWGGRAIARFFRCLLLEAFVIQFHLRRMSADQIEAFMERDHLIFRRVYIDDDSTSADTTAVEVAAAADPVVAVVELDDKLWMSKEQLRYRRKQRKRDQKRKRKEEKNERKKRRRLTRGEEGSGNVSVGNNDGACNHDDNDVASGEAASGLNHTGEQSPRDLDTVKTQPGELRGYRVRFPSERPERVEWDAVAITDLSTVAESFTHQFVEGMLLWVATRV
eukprot:TRINITY_DN53_c0_g2_i1.p1 TRINITY_DN53_c0_g2~~TRINITY_DN53_c0_g2_i1.p1  ORF type:complete len:699 (+),score=117.73 TRINITY_DN53_c0_g2_i1:155-2251(+)